jgi:16S rRNA (guanine(966)-N(2))-methyltransferase RsmD
MRERVRRSLFDILAPLIPGARCLDLFAGTGSLGLEALSRGASFCVFVESNREALRALRGNIEKLGYGSRSLVFPGSVERFLLGGSEVGDPFRVIFADPPFDSGWGERLLRLLPPALLAPEGVLAMQLSPREPAPGEGKGLFLSREESYGDSRLLFYRWRDG